MLATHRLATAAARHAARPNRHPCCFGCALVLAGLGLLAPPLLAVTPTRTEDQRVVYDYENEPLPAGSLLGSTLAMGGDCPTHFFDFPVLAGAPEDGTIVGFGHAPGAGWALRHISFGFGYSHPTAVDFHGEQGVLTQWRPEEGTTSIRLVGCSYNGSDVITGLTDEVAAVATYGDVIAVGHPGYAGDAGRLRIYERSGTSWALVKTFVGTTGERLGAALDLKEAVLVAGAPGYGDNGAVRIYVRDTDSWDHWQRIDSPAAAPQLDAHFGAAVAIDGSGWRLARPTSTGSPARASESTSGRSTSTVGSSWPTNSSPSYARSAPPITITSAPAWRSATARWWRARPEWTSPTPTRAPPSSTSGRDRRGARPCG